MSDHTNIEWCDATWPIVGGCQKAGPDCNNCWAIRDAWRLAHNPNPKIASQYTGLTTIQNGRLNWTGKKVFRADRLDWPDRWRKPRWIFVASSSDLFYQPNGGELLRIFAKMRDSQHVFIILTKHPEVAVQFFVENPCPLGITFSDYFKGRIGDPQVWPFPNVIIGTSVGDQATADKRLPHVVDLSQMGWTTVVSYEPAIGPVDWNKDGVIHHIDWLIAGGESGPGARPVDPYWFRDARYAAREAGTAFFFKQWGTQRGGKKVGRLLDGREWSERPEMRR